MRIHDAQELHASTGKHSIVHHHRESLVRLLENIELVGYITNTLQTLALTAQF